MLTINIPGNENLQLNHLVLDYNGTLAIDGQLIDGVAERLQALANSLQIHVVTADTFGSVETALEGVDCKLAILPPNHSQDIAKLEYIEHLDSTATVTIGNGRNDHLMLKSAALGIAVIQAEGIAVETLTAADVVTGDILAALDLLQNPKRLVATLRS